MVLVVLRLLAVGLGRYGCVRGFDGVGCLIRPRLFYIRLGLLLGWYGMMPSASRVFWITYLRVLSKSRRHSTMRLQGIASKKRLPKGLPFLAPVMRWAIFPERAAR